MKKWTLWNYYLITALIVISIVCIINESSLLFSVSSITGIIYTLFVVKNIKWGLIFGIINVSTYGYICIKASLYGGIIYNLGYCLPMLIWGTINWFRLDKKDHSGIKFIKRNHRLNIIILSIISIIIYGSILYFLEGKNIVLDSIASVLGYLGIYLLTNKYYEQWPVFIIVNSTNLILWITLTIKNINSLPLAVMWLVYLINSIYGQISWKKNYLNKIKPLKN